MREQIFSIPSTPSTGKGHDLVPGLKPNLPPRCRVPRTPSSHQGCGSHPRDVEGVTQGKAGPEREWK